MTDANKPKKEPRNKPCEQCRARKVKCIYSDGYTDCMRCAAQNIECIFSHVISATQDRKRSVEDSNEASQSTGKRRALSQHSLPHFIASSSRSESGGLPDDDPFNGRDPGAPSNSLLNRTLGLAKEFHARYVGATSSFPIFKFASKRKIRRVSENQSFITTSDASTNGYHSEIESLHAIEACVAPHGKKLVNLYFRIVHPSFPILHKKVFYEKYARSYTEFSPPLLAVVYILALQWWEYGRDLPHKGQKPDEQRLRALAQESFCTVLHRPKLSTVQAGLLLAQGRDGSNWSHLSQVLAVAHELGLHLDCSDWSIPSWERGLRKRLAWAIFMQDKWGAVSKGCPSYVHEADWMVQPVTEADFPEGAEDEDQEEGSTEVEKGRELFSHMISLTQILSEVVKSFCTVTMHRDMLLRTVDHRTVMEKAKMIQTRLRSWYSKLPENLSLRSVQAMKFSSVGYLHLAYFVVQITLHRAILHIASNLHMADEATEADHDFFTVCYREASSTFTSAATLISNLRPEHLQSFWYFSSSYGLALIGTLGCELWAISTTEKSAWKSRLGEYRWTLRVSAKSAEFMEAAVDALNEMIQALEESEAEEAVVKATQDEKVKNSGLDLSDRSSLNENARDVPFEFSSFDFSMIDSTHGSHIASMTPGSAYNALVSQSADGTPSSFFVQYPESTEVHYSWLPQ